MAGCAQQDLSHQVEAIAAAGQGDFRLMSELVGQAAHCLGRNVRRVADDQVVALAAERGKRIGLQQANASAQPVVSQVDASNRERRGRNVCRIDSGAGEAMGGQDGQATRPGTQVEHRCDLARRCDPGRQVLAQEVRDVRARDDDALIHVEREVAEPGFARQVGGRLAPAYAPVEQLADVACGGRGDGFPEDMSRRVER